MGLRCILIPSTAADDCADRLTAAINLAQRLHAHVRLLFVRTDPRVTYAGLPDVIRASVVTRQQIEEAGRQEAANSRAAFGRLCDAAGIRSDGHFPDLQSTFGAWAEQVGEIEPLVSLAGRVSDLIVVNRPSTSIVASERIFDAAVFSSGRPTLVVSDQVPDDLLRHVVIAWNGSLEAARLVGHAIDLLRGAGRVSVTTAATERSSETAGADLQNYLMWHGIRAHQLAASPDHFSAAEALLATAMRAEATMIMMGAYTHSRVRQFLLGGVTRHMLQHATIPLLMEH